MKYQLTFLFTLLNLVSYAQVGIGTEEPKAELDVQSVFTTTYLMDINFSDDTDGISTSGSPAWSVQAYQDSICFSSNNTTATQNTDVTIAVEIPPAKVATMTFDLFVDLTAHGFLDLSGGIYTSNDNSTWQPITIPLNTGNNKIILKMYGNTTSNFPGKVAIDNVKVSFQDGYALRINDQNQVDGYVLTTDEYGNATWMESQPDILVDNDGDTYVEALDQNAITMTIQGSQNFHMDSDSLGIFGEKISFGFPPVNKSTGSLSMTWGAFSEASGTKSTAWGDNSTASGEHSTAWGKGNTASGQNASSWGENNTAIGKNAAAFGYMNVGSGDQSTTSGSSNISSGTNSIALGQYSRASGQNALAFGTGLSLGDSTIATKSGSVAIGRKSKATGSHSSVLGGWNNESSNEMSMSFGNSNISSGTGSTSWGLENQISGSYSTGWGYQNTATSQYSTVFGVNSHVTGLHGIAMGNNVRVSGENGIGIGNGSRAEGLHSKAIGGIANGESAITIGSDSTVVAIGLKSLAIGGVNDYSSDSIVARGDYSVAIGRLAKAEGISSFAALGGKTSAIYSMALGYQTNTYGNFSIALMGGKSEGYQSFAWGGGDPFYYTNDEQRNNAVGNYSMALGARSNTTLGYGSMVWGENNLSSASLSTSWGLDNQANGEKSTTWGQSNQANGTNSTVWGNDNFVPGEEATAWGKAARAEGLRTTAFGFETRASSYASTSLGRYNKLQTNANQTQWVADDPLFVVGNGSVLSRNDAIHLKKNGHLGINTVPDEFFHIYDNAPLIAKLESTSNSRLILDGSSSTIEFQSFSDDNVKFEFESWYSSPINYFDLWTFKNGNQDLVFRVDDNSDFIFGEAVEIDNFDEDTYALQLKNDVNKGKARAYSWNTYSDKRIKTKILPLTVGLPEILSLNPKRYNQHISSFQHGKLTLGNEHSKTLGLIAQEVYDVLPEVVVKPNDPSSELWSMDYPKLIPVLINAVKELNDINKEQNKRISIIELENQALKKQLRDYESLETRITALENLK